ncbi:endonuclease/exonuclease/phosphatase family protein [Oceanicaulis alexandrii]|uniref:endonuclease/exonuclease/phosphatase family protein n=1 Tax=Oceanicaulis alexandrii TaxID=153233 RepID=UPI0035D0CF5C
MLQPPPLLTAVFRLAAYAACLGACICLALTYGVLMSGSYFPKADVFNMIWPVPAAAGALAGTALFVLRPKGLTLLRRVGLMASALLILLAFPYAQLRPHPDTLPPRSETGDALQLVTFNLWNLNRDPDAAITFLREGDFDLVFLQETGGALQYVPASLQDAYPHQVRCPWGATLISRLPVLDQGCDEYRTVPIAFMQIDFQGAPLRLTSTHFARPTRPDLYQYHRERLSALIAAQTEHSQILAGDFNTAEKGFSMRALTHALAPLRRVTHGLRTWPSKRLIPLPMLGIDHIWISDGLCASQTGAAPDAGSDHRPVFTLVERCEA